MDPHPLERWRNEEAGRRSAPLPAYDLAAELGCSASRYSQIVNGDAPGRALAMRIKQHCGISLDELYAASREEAAQ